MDGRGNLRGGGGPASRGFFPTTGGASAGHAPTLHQLLIRAEDEVNRLEGDNKELRRECKELLKEVDEYRHDYQELQQELRGANNRTRELEAQLKVARQPTVHPPPHQVPISVSDPQILQQQTQPPPRPKSQQPHQSDGPPMQRPSYKSTLPGFDAPTNRELINNLNQLYSLIENWAKRFPLLAILNDQQQPAMMSLYNACEQYTRPGFAVVLLQNAAMKPFIIVALIIHEIFDDLTEEHVLDEWYKNAKDISELIYTLRDWEEVLNQGKAVNRNRNRDKDIAARESSRAYIFKKIQMHNDFEKFRNAFSSRILNGPMGLEALLRPAIPQDLQRDAFIQLRPLVLRMIDLFCRINSLARIWLFIWKPYMDPEMDNPKYKDLLFYQDQMVARNLHPGQPESAFRGRLVSLQITPIIEYREIAKRGTMLQTLIRAQVLLRE
ncbi:hypothetical protein NA57DRAFT_51372 [Rhizodiscina lignyota]|uniref:Uncharacterized protein n=1 Tax=Rhizodiscina lignyota TaxID=1504668 RepID=A0A9P4IU81_9PEZI|nr:hypothetical protein NA57DRAFT_51372 [Rhizodiscina lignyota]